MLAIRAGDKDLSAGNGTNYTCSYITSLPQCILVQQSMWNYVLLTESMQLDRIYKARYHCGWDGWDATYYLWILLSTSQVTGLHKSTKLHFKQYCPHAWKMYRQSCTGDYSMSEQDIQQLMMTPLSSHTSSSQTHGVPSRCSPATMHSLSTGIT